MGFSNVLVISDNIYLARGFFDLVKEFAFSGVDLKAGCSFSTIDVMRSGLPDVDIRAYDLNADYHEILDRFELILSLHCKQLFPPELVQGCRCINVHPGLNPYNRGWFPQVFSILNGMPFGATIHEIDEEIDHGPVISQKEVRIKPEDTSYTAYRRVLDAELMLLNENILAIMNDQYTVVQPLFEGNVNYFRDYKSMLEIDLDEEGSMGYFINKIRALTHGEYRNAYFIDEESGDRIYITVSLDRVSGVID